MEAALNINSSRGPAVESLYVCWSSRHNLQRMCAHRPPNPRQRLLQAAPERLQKDAADRSSSIAVPTAADALPAPIVIVMQ